jgi:hypothetical protein
VGHVFEWYRDGVIDADDEVALLHASEAEGFRPLSEPLVNVRHTLQRAVAEGWLDGARARELIEECRATHYAERSWKRLLLQPAARGWPAAEAERLARYVAERRVDVKREDAELALRLCTGELPARRVTLAAKSPLWDLGRLLRSRFGSGPTALGADVLEAALQDAALAARSWRELVTRRFALEWARAHGLRCGDGFTQSFAAEWARGTRVDDALLAANALSPGAYERLVGERAQWEWLRTAEAAALGLGPDPVAEDRERRLVREWARDAGVDPERLDFILDEGPDGFGITWSFEAALLQELQLTGRAAAIAEGLARP